MKSRTMKWMGCFFGNPVSAVRIASYRDANLGFVRPKVSVTVPKMEVQKYLIRLFWGWGFPYISRIHTAYIGEDSSILGT